MTKGRGLRRSGGEAEEKAVVRLGHKQNLAATDLACCLPSSRPMLSLAASRAAVILLFGTRCLKLEDKDLEKKQLVRRQTPKSEILSRAASTNLEMAS